MNEGLMVVLCLIAIATSLVIRFLFSIKEATFVALLFIFLICVLDAIMKKITKNKKGL